MRLLRFESSGEAVAAVSPAAAFAFLADPHNASFWFAGAGFASPPVGSLAAGMTWQFSATPGTRRVTPARMALYEPPDRFRWETALPGWQTNFAWEMVVAPGEGGTQLRFTMQLYPGVLELPFALIGFRLTRRALLRAAYGTVEQAAQALAARYPRGDSGTRPAKPKRPRR